MSITKGMSYHKKNPVFGWNPNIRPFKNKSKNLFWVFGIIVFRTCFVIVVSFE